MRSRRALLALFCLVFAAGGAEAPAQSSPPSGGATVVVGRIFHAAPEGTLPVARFGFALSGEGIGRGRVEVAPRPDDAAAGYVVELTAERRRAGIRLGWTLSPAGGAGVEASRGVLDLTPGRLAHLPFGRAGETRLQASIESGPAFSFDAAKLSRHFAGLAAPSPTAAPSRPAPREAASSRPQLAAAAAEEQRPEQPGTAGILTLSFTLEQDGEIAFAPRVRVRESEEFAIRSGRTLEAAGTRWDGFELRGSARRAGASCLVDFSLQSGRRLEGAGPETWLVDRYRREAAVPIGRRVAFELFEDLEGEAAGRSRLLVDCTPE